MPQVAQSTNRVYLNADSLLLNVNQHTVNEKDLVNASAGDEVQTTGLW